MKRVDQALPDDELPRPGESFLARFHRRKLEARQENAAAPIEEAPTPEPDAIEEPPTDADMPSLDTLDAESDYTGFLSPKVSETLRRAALRKLFHSARFNIVDGLDEYAEDFTSFESLGDIVTADMRHLIDVEARKKVEALEPGLDGATDDATGPEAPEVETSSVDGNHEQADAAPTLTDQSAATRIDNLTETAQHHDIKQPTNT